MPEPEAPPTETPLTQFTPAQLSQFIDSHLIMALVAGDTLYAGDRQQAEDYLRDRLVAVSDSWDTPAALEAEHRHRRDQRIMRMLLSEAGRPR